MTLADALRLTEVLLALALVQQSAEHVFYKGAVSRSERFLFALRAGICLLLIGGVAPPLPLVALALLSLAILNEFQGPYNGGSDRLGLLALWSLTVAAVAATVLEERGERWQELALGYLAVQLVLSYFVSGFVKLRNPDWRNGQALRDVFLFSAYPRSEALRGLASRPRLLLGLSWLVMLFEIAFPLALVSPIALALALSGAALFHLANAYCFGLNRFFWTWLACYPSVIWLQARIT